MPSALAPRPRSLLLALSAVISACAAEVVSVPSDSAAAPDASEVGQDVPQDAGLDVPIAMDVPADRGPDVVTVDVPPVDVPPVDVPPMDVPPVDVAPIDGGSSLACLTGGTPPSQTCAPALCGNGRIDSCQRCMPCFGGGPGGGPPGRDAGVCCTDEPEQCDGDALAGATCVSLGYAGGTLRCGAWCGRDTRGCDACAISAHTRQCIRADVAGVAPTSLAVAATASEIGVAWASDDGHAVHFARYSPALVKLSERDCLGVGDARGVALAAVDGGWILAVGTEAGTRVVPLSPDGSNRGAGSLLPLGMTPTLAGRPSGGPLLTATSYGDRGGVVNGVVLNADGTQASAVQALIPDEVEAGYGSAAWVGDGWLVASRGGRGTGGDLGVLVVRVEPDGRASAPVQPVGAQTEYPQLAWADGAVWLTHASFGGASPGISRVRLDTHGRPMPGSLDLGHIPSYFNPSPVVGVGTDSLILLGTYTGSTGHGRRLEVTRVDASGRTVVDPYAITTGPELARGYRLVRQGPDAVVAWIGAGFPGRVGLAVVSP
jgi:hypothetical protein